MTHSILLLIFPEERAMSLQFLDKCFSRSNLAESVSGSKILSGNLQSPLLMKVCESG